MRISQDRYDHDRLKFDLAVRMLHWHAPSRTICARTGLTPDRLRKLRRAYSPPRRTSNTVHPRIRTARDPGCFLRSPTLAWEASTLGSLFCMLGLIPRSGGICGLQLTELLCTAYETYRTLHPRARLSLQHASVLLDALLAGELKLSTCSGCRRLYLADRTRLDLARCGCDPHRLGIPRRRRQRSEVSA